MRGVHHHRARPPAACGSSSTADALEYVSRIDSKIILINGSRLARLMFEHGIGVATASTYQVKRIDSDYFADA